ncbi:hypothetical protein KFL_005720030 [Klebsormidium nitens]|uniref:Threonylcarbamoyl-AMP synthase n=1 Tax=Klebsormidium nitens TaxID=105231 RepID=A0A1Y1IGV7_KLENI|nr:hypothetical protein KFL_005720030 [Klebsormidium nitens]|eukprot:GAQ89873.1 hypothetical protein KFL_005720030 [Klebsormidium nitens]
MAASARCLQRLPLHSLSPLHSPDGRQASALSPGLTPCQHCQGRLLPDHGNFLGIPKSLALLVHGLLGLNARERVRPCRAARIEAVTKRNPKRLKYAGSGGGEKLEDCVYVEVSQDASDGWKLDQIADAIKGGGVGVIPTDTMYAFVCDLENKAAVDRLYRIKDLDPKKPLSILCRNFADIDTYTLGFPKGSGQGSFNVFKVVKQYLPGPYTFILKASKALPKQCANFGGSLAASCAPRKSVGVRMPADPICAALLERLDRPLLCTSVRTKSEEEWMLDPVYIADEYKLTKNGEKGVDFVVDGGQRMATPSTVVDMTGATPLLLRQGKGEVDEFLVDFDASAEITRTPRGAPIVNPYATVADNI